MLKLQKKHITTGGETLKFSPLIVKGGTSLQEKTGAWRFFRPIIDEDSCTGCGRCYLFCPDSAVKITVIETKVARGRKRLLFEFDYDYCKGCGICAEECPSGAISMIPEEK